MAAPRDEYDPATLTLDEAHPKLQALNSKGHDALVEFVNARGQQSKEGLSELIVRNMEFMEQADQILAHIDARQGKRAERIAKVQAQQTDMEAENTRRLAENEQLTKSIAELEELIKKQEEHLDAARNARMQAETKMDAAFLKQVNKYFQKNAEYPVVNMVNMFVGLLRNDKDVSQIDVELIFKTHGSFLNKLKSAQPALVKDDVMDYFYPLIEMYKKFLKDKDDEKTAEFCDVRGPNAPAPAGREERLALIEEQRKVMGPYVHFLVWADAYLSLARKEVFKRKARKSIADKNRRIADNLKAVEHNKIILGNYQNDNLEHNLLEEQTHESNARVLISQTAQGFTQILDQNKAIFRKFEDNYFASSHQKFSEEKRLHASPHK